MNDVDDDVIAPLNHGLLLHRCHGLEMWDKYVVELCRKWRNYFRSVVSQIFSRFVIWLQTITLIQSGA